jgi:hypothetical protein
MHQLAFLPRVERPSCHLLSEVLVSPVEGDRRLLYGGFYFSPIPPSHPRLFVCSPPKPTIANCEWCFIEKVSQSERAREQGSGQIIVHAQDQHDAQPKMTGGGNEGRQSDAIAKMHEEESDHSRVDDPNGQGNSGIEFSRLR